MFLGSLVRVAPLLEKPLDPDARTAMETSLRYFREAAPKHTADEEESLFPRLRSIHSPEVEAALGTLDPLEHDHRRADSLHAQVDRLGRRCLETGRLLSKDAHEFTQAVTELAAIYKRAHPHRG